MGLELVSSDAKVVGTVEGAILDLSEWKVKALKVGLRHGTEGLIGHRRRHFAIDRILIGTEDLGTVSDIILMKRPLAELNGQVRTKDSKLMPAVAFLGIRVMSDDGIFLGNVDNISIDTANGWAIKFVQVKLGRDSRGRLERRHGLKASSLIDIRTEDVRAMGDMMILSLDLDQVRGFLTKDVSSNSKVRTGIGTTQDGGPP